MKKVMRKRSYKIPTCIIYPIEMVENLCTSVSPKVPGTKEELWGNDEVEEGGELEL